MRALWKTVRRHNGLPDQFPVSKSPRGSVWFSSHLVPPRHCTTTRWHSQVSVSRACCYTERLAWYSFEPRSLLNPQVRNSSSHAAGNSKTRRSRPGFLYGNRRTGWCVPKGFISSASFLTLNKHVSRHSGGKTYQSAKSSPYSSRKANWSRIRVRLNSHINNSTWSRNANEFAIGTDIPSTSLS